MLIVKLIKRFMIEESCQAVVSRASNLGDLGDLAIDHIGNEQSVLSPHQDKVG